MKPTFHIIEEIEFDLKYDLIAKDSYGNSIHIPKNRIRELKITKKWVQLEELDEGLGKMDIKIENLNFPFFVLAKTTKYQNKDLNKLVAFVLFKKLSEVIDAYESNLALSMNLNFANDEYDYSLKCIKQITIEHENYIRNKVISSNQTKFKLPETFLNKLTEAKDYCDRLDENEDLVIIIDKKLKFYPFVDAMIYPWIEALKNEKFKLLQLEEGMYPDDAGFYFPNSIHIRTKPLFHFIDSKGKGPSYLKQKIITPEKFKKLDKSLPLYNYLHQFYHLKGANYKELSLQDFNWKIYKREYSSGYSRRVYNKLKTPFIVAIQPWWHPNIDNETLAVLHGQIERVSTLIVKSGISNLIILPPLNDINGRIELEEDFENRKDDIYDEQERIMHDEFFEQGMREIDDQDEGWWRIANDID